MSSLPPSSHAKSSSCIAGKGICLPKIREKRLFINGHVPRVLNEEIPEAQILGMQEYRPKFFKGNPAVQRRTPGELANG
jgi:hypothetical protein